uniref:putative nuclease HARBI1 n=1 Tax=Pristiophorus japonicus TaxID=55135 RepID=UPI00398F29CD
MKVTIALNFYASGSFQGATADISNISQFVAHCSICDVRDALYRRRMEYETTVFIRIVGFPMVQGAIDCTHVALRALHHNPEIFRKRKRYYSLNVQLVCDHTCTIMAINAHYPGSNHDAFILSQTGVPALFQPPSAAPGWLLGDKGYPLCTWLMISSTTPPLLPSTLTMTIMTRCIIQQTIGVLKQWFCCLDCSGGVLQYSPDRVSLFIVVCCMLHNLAIMRAQPLPEDIAIVPQEEEEEQDEEVEDLQEKNEELQEETQLAGRMRRQRPDTAREVETVS